ncbi:MAG: glycosyltransferase family 1 protein, partial [Saprospiraceae bacterium]
NIYLRKSSEGQFSIEKLYEGLADHLANHQDFDIRLIVMPHFSKGFVSRMKNILFAAQQKADIHHISGDIHYLTLAFRPAKTVLTIHDFGLMYQFKGLKLLLFTILWFKIPVWWTKKVIVISEKTKQDLMSFVHPPEQKVEIIPNFIHPRFLEAPVHKCKDNLPCILHIGTYENKNLMRLVQALVGLDVHLHVIGKLKENQRIYIQNKIKNFESSMNLSDVDLIDAYQNADIVYFASTFEGFGMPILEAQALGIPVITSNISPMREVAGQNGACLVNPYVSSEIRNGIINIFSDINYRESLISYGLSNVKRFTIQKFAEQHIDLYKKMKIGK